MKTVLLLGALYVGAAAAFAQASADAPKQVPAEPAPKVAAPAPRTAAPAPKPAAKNPNVVVLRSETKFWNDAALNKVVSMTVKDADARAAVATLAQASALPMNVIVPPPPAAVNPPVPTANGARQAAPTPVQPARVSIEFKNQPVRDIMQALANTYHLSWRKDGATYVLRDMNFVDTLRAEQAAQSNTSRQPGYNNGYNNNANGDRNGGYNRRGRREMAPGVYRERRRGR